VQLGHEIGVVWGGFVPGTGEGSADFGLLENGFVLVSGGGRADGGGFCEV
jgi:hypothetical protein